MNIWEILGIPPTADIAVIKEAYADRAKEWHPEEHPEEFKRLRNAYQAAVRSAKSGGVEKAGAGAEPPPAKRAEPQQEQPQQEQPQSEEQEEEEEHRPEFSYDDVSSYYQSELAGDFFKEFYRIAWNPYLQNRKAVWHYFLFRPDYDDLYCHEGFRQKLLQEICAVSGWHGETLDYFEWWQDIFWEPKQKGQRDDSRTKTDSRQWNRKKWRSRFTCFMPEHVVSQEQRQEHYAILQILKDRGLDGSLMNVASADAYLKYYRAFVKDNEEWPEIQRRFNCRKRLKYWITFSILSIFLAIILMLVLVVRPVMNAEKKEKQQEQGRQEEVILQEEQESREQEEWQQELDERFENMQEQYRDWLEQ